MRTNIDQWGRVVQYAAISSHQDNPSLAIKLQATWPEKGDPILKDLGPTINENLRSWSRWPHPKGSWSMGQKRGLRFDRVRKTTSETRPSKPKGWPHREGPEPLNKKSEILRSDWEWGLKQSRPKGWPHREEITNNLKEFRPNLRSGRGPHQPRPCRGDPIAKVLNHKVEENPQELRTTRANWRANDKIQVNDPSCEANSGCTTTGHEVNLPKAHNIAVDETRRRQSTAKYQNVKQDKGAAASNKKFLRSDRGRMNTTTRP